MFVGNSSARKVEDRSSFVRGQQRGEEVVGCRVSLVVWCSAASPNLGVGEVFGGFGVYGRLRWARRDVPALAPPPPAAELPAWKTEQTSENLNFFFLLFCLQKLLLGWM